MKPIKSSKQEMTMKPEYKFSNMAFRFWLFVKAIGEIIIEISAKTVTKDTSAFSNDEFLSTWQQFLTFKSSNQGIVLGSRLRLPLKRSYEGFCVVASVGMGKTTSLIIPNVLECSGSMVVTDPSREIYNLTSGHLQDRGYDVQILNTSDIESSFSYNPLERIKDSKDAKRIANILITATYGNSKGDDVFWNKGGETILYLLISVLLDQPQQYRNLHNVKRLLDRFGSSGQDIDQLFVAKGDDNLLFEFRGFISQTEKIRQSMVATARTALDRLSDPDICRLCSSSKYTLDLKNLRKKKTAIFIVSKEDKIKYFSFIYRLLYTEIFETLMDMPEDDDLPVFMFLDEMANIGAIPNFSSYATTIRKRRACLFTVLQDLSQLTSLYGKEGARTILDGGMSNMVYFSGLGLETAKVVSETLGKQAVMHRQKGDQVIREKPLLSAPEVRQMKRNQALYIYAEKPPLKFRLKPFFKSKRLIRLTEKKPAPIKHSLKSIPIEFLSLKSPDPINENIPDIDLMDE